MNYHPEIAIALMDERRTQLTRAAGSHHRAERHRVVARLRDRFAAGRGLGAVRPASSRLGVSQSA